MRHLWLSFILCFVTLIHADPLAIRQLQAVDGVASYVFADQKVVVAVGAEATDSTITIARAEQLHATFWADVGTDSVVFVTTGGTEYMALLDSLDTVNKTVTTITLTAEEQADIVAGGIPNKSAALHFAALCADIRSDDPTLTDLQVRLLAKGGL